MNIYFLKLSKERGMFSCERHTSWSKYGFYKRMNKFNDTDSISNTILVYFFLYINEQLLQNGTCSKFMLILEVICVNGSLCEYLTSFIETIYLILIWKKEIYD